MTASVYWDQREIIEWQNDQLRSAGREPIAQISSGTRFIRMRELVTIVGLKRSSIYERIAAGKFPKPSPLPL